MTQGGRAASQPHQLHLFDMGGATAIGSQRLLASQKVREYEESERKNTTK